MHAVAGEVLRCLLVQAGQHLCALPIAQVRRVERALPVHPLPGAAPGLLGLIEFGGEPLPLLDLATLVEAPPGANPSCPVTLVAWAGSGARRERVGLAVDAAVAIADLDLAGLAGRPQGLVRGEVSLAGRAGSHRVVRLLDLERLGDDVAGSDVQGPGQTSRVDPLAPGDSGVGP